MKVAATTKEGKMTIFLAGELDHRGAKEAMPIIERHIESQMPRDCVIDMSGITFMDSSGIAVIIKTYKRMNGAGGRMWIENVPKQPMRVLDAAGVERIIRISIMSE